MIRSVTIGGKPFELSVQEAGKRDWHWLIAAPGQVVLSGAAASEIQALQSAYRAAQALARLAAA
jgi:O-acetyl-ADP-ribose deacetylase (regulator of RNase III)